MFYRKEPIINNLRDKFINDLNKIHKNKGDVINMKPSEIISEGYKSTNYLFLPNEYIKKIDKEYINKEELRKKINKEKEYITKHRKDIVNYQRCLLELDIVLKLLEE